MTHEKTIAFFSLLNDKISALDTSNNFWKKLKAMFPEGKRYKSYPAVKVGRLGVSQRHQSEGLGSKLMDYIKILFLKKNKSGCRYITVDAYNKPRVLAFYERNHFNYFRTDNNSKMGKTRLMYFDLRELQDD